MTQHADILDQREPMTRAFVGALALHVTVAAGFALYNWMGSHHDTFGAPNAGGGAIGIEAVNTIPLAHNGMQNPVANDSESQVPQQPKAEEAVKKEKESPDAVALKRRERKRLTDVASERQRYRPYKQIDPNQVFAKAAPQVANPLYSAMPGSG